MFKTSDNRANKIAETHDAVSRILPWHVNATLEDDERDLVESHLRECLVCRRELGILRQLASTVTERDRNVACENALASLHARLDKKLMPWHFPWAAAASMVLIVGLVFIASNRVTEGLLDFSAGFQTLGNRPDAAINRVSRSARVIFRAEVDATEMVALLDTVDASIAAGPSQRGAYTIKFSDTLSSLEQTQAIQNLRDSGRVLFVEPVLVTMDERYYAF